MEPRNLVPIAYTAQSPTRFLISARSYRVRILPHRCYATQLLTLVILREQSISAGLLPSSFSTSLPARSRPHNTAQRTGETSQHQRPTDQLVQGMVSSAHSNCNRRLKRCTKHPRFGIVRRRPCIDNRFPEHNRTHRTGNKCSWSRLTNMPCRTSSSAAIIWRCHRYTPTRSRSYSPESYNYPPKGNNYRIPVSAERNRHNLPRPFSAGTGGIMLRLPPGPRRETPRTVWNLKHSFPRPPHY